MLANSFNGIEIKKELTDLIGVASDKIHNKFLNFPSAELNQIVHDAASKKKLI